jgi:predicted dehydrogenase
MEGDDEPYVKLMGTEGGAFFKGDRLTFFTEKFGRLVDVDALAPENNHNERVLLSQHFIECIKEGKTPITSALSGLRTNLIIDAIFESSRLGREVTIDWDI